MTKNIAFLFSAAFATTTALAGEHIIAIDKTYKAPEPELCFEAGELQLDIFGQYTDGNGPSHAGPIREHGWGGGLGLNYFFTRNLGVGVDAAWLNAEEFGGGDYTIIHNFSGSLILRFPIDDKCIAPYLYVGGGAAVDGLQWASAHGGAGIEFRVKPRKLGVFLDTRYTYYGDRHGNGDLGNLSGRVGLRIIF
jgi:hypothetical protein